MIVMEKVSVICFEARQCISKDLNENVNNFLDYAHGDLIMRAIRFVIDPRYEFKEEVNDLWMNFRGIKSVVIVFKNTGTEPDKYWIGETVTVIRKITNNLKTIEWNDRRVKVKTFYNLIHQDYEPDGEPIRRPYIITGEDANEFKNFSHRELFQFVDSAVTLNQHLQMREMHDAFIRRISGRLAKSSNFVNKPQRSAALNALTTKFKKLSKDIKENQMLSTANKDTMDKKLFSDVQKAIDKAEKWFITLIESNELFHGFQLKFFFVTDENCTTNEMLQMNALSELTFCIYDADGLIFDTTTSVQLCYFIYVALCLGLIEQVGFPYLLIAIDDFCGGFHRKIQEIIEGMNTNVQFVILEN